MDSYEISANAKINIFLRICGKLPNGYHKLYMVMQEIDISDDVTVNLDSERPAGIDVVCSDLTGLDPTKNLCYKAADRFYARLHKKLVSEGTREKIVFPHTEIILRKGIPNQAGMGGGSSDAAAVLLALQEHFGEPFNEEELNETAVNIGADVPFFLYGGTGLCEGVGEEVTQLDAFPKWPLLIVKPRQGVSTARSYSEVDKLDLPPLDKSRYEELFRELLETDGDLDRADEVLDRNRELLINDLQAPGIDEVPVIRDIISSLEKEGASLALMTGSGSAVFGLFKTTEDAEKVRKALASDARFSDCDFFVTGMI